MAKNKGKGGPVQKAKKGEIIAKLKTLIESGEIDHTNYEDVANDFKTTRQTIGNYVNEIYESIPPEEIKKVLIDFRIIFNKLQMEVETALAEARTVKERLEVVRTYFQFMKEKTDFLERFFVKAKAQENINIQADITQKQFVINYNLPNGSTIEQDNN